MSAPSTSRRYGGQAELTARSVPFWLVAVIAAGIIFIGVRFILRPLPAAAAFGVAADGTPTYAYLWAKGTRDIVSGLLLFALLGLGAGRKIIGAFLGVAALIPLGDFMNVYANVGMRHPGALATHGATAVFMLILGAWLLVARSHVLGDVSKGLPSRRRTTG